MDNPRTIADIITDLSSRFQTGCSKPKPSAAKNTLYPWYTAVRFLDLYAPGWSYEIRSVTGVADQLIVVARISIPCTEGVIYREATGIEDTTVKAMAIRRAMRRA
jgi:hypothetical protein